MKKILPCLICAVLLFCCPCASALDKFDSEDIQFLRSCGLEQADIDIIPKLANTAANEIIQDALVYKSTDRQNSIKYCRYLQDFKNTREYLRKLKPSPRETALPPPGKYSSIFMTKDEWHYIHGITQKVMEQDAEELKKMQPLTLPEQPMYEDAKNDALWLHKFIATRKYIRALKEYYKIENVESLFNIKDKEKLKSVLDKYPVPVAFDYKYADSLSQGLAINRYYVW